jgi:hypothetical protein
VGIQRRKRDVKKRGEDRKKQKEIKKMKGVRAVVVAD